MKKIILSLLFSFTFIIGHSQNLFEDFEGASLPDVTTGNWTLTSGDWKVLNNGIGLNQSWKVATLSSLTYGGTGRSADVQREFIVQNTTSEDWLVTPRRLIRANEQLRFFTRQGLTGDTGTLYQIRVSANIDPTIQSAYTIFSTFTENELLATPTALFSEYNEKVINMTQTGQNLFIAFVKVHTQTGPGVSGDRWLIDDVRFALRCLEPINLNAVNKTCGSAVVTWDNPGNAANFEYEWGTLDFTQGTGTLATTTSGLASNPSNLISFLNPDTPYEYYVRAICGPGRISAWVGPYQFRTLLTGATCDCPISFTTLPYSDNGDTLDFGDNILQASPGASGCGTTGNFLEGTDAVYLYTPTTSGQIRITMNPNGAINTGVFVYDSCADIGVNCLAGVANTNSTIRVIPSLNVVAGTSYYIVISSTALPLSFQYNLIVQQVTCNGPTALTGTTTATTANIGWTGPTGATNWQYLVQTPGPLGQTPGTPTISNLPANNIITQTYSGALLVPGTNYEYWVRADCGNGTFSVWSGPFPFQTKLCAPANQCTYKFILNDTGADGWEGAQMIVRQNGVDLLTLGSQITAGTATVNVPLCDDLPFQLFWSVPGTNPAEVGVVIQNSFGQTIYTMTAPNAGLLGTVLYPPVVPAPLPPNPGLAECTRPECQKLTNAFTANTPTVFGATLTWTPPAWVTTAGYAYEVYVAAAPFTAPVGFVVPVPNNTTTFLLPSPLTIPYVIPESVGLQQDTQYRYWVRILCTGNGPSEWSTTFGTFTTLPKCAKATALSNGTTFIAPLLPPATLLTATAPLYWTTPATPATTNSWYVLALPVTVPATPTPTFDPLNIGAWIAVPGPNAPSMGTPFELTGLLPDTQYNYYVVSNCQPLNGVSNVAGPKLFTTPPTCPKPTALNVVTPVTTPYTIKMYWTYTPTPVPTTWRVNVKLATFVGTPTDTDPDWYTITPTVPPLSAAAFYEYGLIEPPLLQNTNYKYFVQAVCGGVNGNSTTAGPKTFTTLRSCIQPSGLAVVPGSITPRNVRLIWNQGVQNGVTSTATSWFVKAVPATEPAPVFVNDGSWFEQTTLPTVGIPFQFPGVYPLGQLVPETLYRYYVVANCGLVDGTSDVGPSSTFTTLPSCIKPLTTTVVPNSQTPFTINLWWVNGTGSTATTWQILAVPTGTVVTAASTGWETFSGPIPTALLPYTYGLAPNTPLLPDTTYDIYVRGDCGTFDGVSQWVGPKTFTTDPTCKKPTNLVWNNDNANPATLTWVEAGTATQWEAYVQPYTAVVSPPTGDGVLVLSPTYNSPATLAPGFYEFYVRAVCSGSDKSKWTGPVLFSVFASSVACAAVDLNLQTGTNTIDVCLDDNCTDLTATFADLGDTTNYNVLPIVFTTPFPVDGGTNLNIGTDDLWSSVQNLPFNFCFFGNNSQQAWVGSNGVLTFTNPNGTFCPWNNDLNIPDAGFLIKNAIYGVYQDIDPSVASPTPKFIKFGTVGVAPCRAFVVNFFDIPQFSCNLTVGLQRSQIVLYETSNIIEVYVQKRTQCTGWNDGNGVIGIQNTNGTVAFTPPGKNTLDDWSITNEAFRFTPAGASIVSFEWQTATGASLSTSTTLNVCPTTTTVYKASATYTNCGVAPVTVTQNVTVNVNNIVVEDKADVSICKEYILPVLTVGKYFTLPNGAGTELFPGDVISTTTTLYIYAQTSTTPICSDEDVFTITILPAVTIPTSSGDISECALTPIQTLTAVVTAEPNSQIIWYDAAIGGNIVASPTWNQLGCITYYAEALNPTTSCRSSRTPVTLCLFDTPLPPTGGDQTQCETLPIQTLTATATAPTGASIVWYDAATGGTVVTAPILNVCGTVTYYAESQVGTAPNICVSATRTAVTLTINCLPLAPTTGGDQTQCETLPIQTLTATATAPTGASIVWYDAATGGTVVTAPSLNACGTVTYYAESQVGTAPNICVSATRTAVTLTINCLPLAPTTGGDQTQCETLPIQTLTATATAPTGASIVWYDAATGGTVVTAPILNVCGTVTYYAESQVGTAPNICVSATRTAVTLTINCLPLAPTTGGDQTQCETLPIQTLTATATAPTGASIVWYDAATGGTVVTAPILNVCGTVTYYAESQVGTAPNICVSATRTAVTLTINCLPLAPTTGGDQTQCETLPIQTLTATATAPTGASIVWYDAATGGTVVTAPILNVCGTVTYYAESQVGTAPNICVSATRTAVTLTINCLPLSPTTGGDQTQCETLPIQTLTATATAPTGASIVWYDAATGGTVVTAPSLNACGTVTYYAESQVGTAPNICVSATRTAVTLTINCLPLAPTTGGDQTQCETLPIQTLTATATAPTGASLVWYDAATGGTVVTAPSLNACGTVTYYAESQVGTAPNICVSATRTAVTLTINCLPLAPTTGGDQTQCETLPIQTLTATATAPTGASIVWYDAATGGAIVANPTLNTVGTTIYYAQAVDATTGCVSAIRTPVTLTIFAIPTAPSAVVQTPICATTPIQTLTAQATPPAGASIVWYDAATLGAVVTAPTLNACGTVIYYAESQVGIAPNICVSTTRTPVTLTINCLPAAPSAIAAQAVCAANPLQTLTATATPPLGATLAWYTASTGGTLLTSQTLNSIGSVTYYAQSVDSATGCVSATRTPVTLRIDDSPKFGIIGGCIGNAYTLEITPIANYIPATATYQWEDALGNPVGTNAPTLIAKTAGNYSCTIINTDGCSSEETYVANTVSCSIQKGISPKGIGVGDGNNDFFDLEALNVTKLQIFNRYGLAVYTKNEYKKEWYGQSDSNNELPDGTYYYVIETKDADPVTGWIYINREQ